MLGYDLLNEPFAKARDGEDLPTAAARLQQTQLPDMYDRLIDAMRVHDPDGWMFVEPPNVALIGLPITLRPPDDERVVLFPHLYDPNIETANYTEGDAQLDLSFFDGVAPLFGETATTAGLPLLIGEWGIAAPERPGMGTFVDESLAPDGRPGIWLDRVHLVPRRGLLRARRRRRASPQHRPGRATVGACHRGGARCPSASTPTPRSCG